MFASIDARDHFNRFSMHVGSDVVEALDEADRQGKTQTHIATSGFDDGERVTIAQLYPAGTGPCAQRQT